MASSERQIPRDIGNRYWFWIWAKLLAVVPSSKKSTSSEQIDGAKHIPFLFLSEYPAAAAIYGRPENIGFEAKQ
jgi:hypothetical protein